jgi:hypothetical protein
VILNILGSFDHLTSGSKISYRVTAVGTNGADVKIELIVKYLAIEENK